MVYQAISNVLKFQRHFSKIEITKKETYFNYLSEFPVLSSMVSSSFVFSCLSFALILRWLSVWVVFRTWTSCNGLKNFTAKCILFWILALDFYFIYATSFELFKIEWDALNRLPWSSMEILASVSIIPIDMYSTDLYFQFCDITKYWLLFALLFAIS
jgi:hypothetical protein